MCRTLSCVIAILVLEISTGGLVGPDEASGQERRPNILFCIADDASYPHMGAYGCSWVKTPGFDRVAREGLLFQNAYTPNAKCAPSRSCLLTGRNPWQLEEACNHWCYFPAKFKTVWEALGEHGYFAGYTAKGWGPGVALDADGNRRELTGRLFNAHKNPPPAEKIGLIDYAANFSDFLKANTDGRPWCFWYGGLEPHRAYEFGAGRRQGGKSLDAIDRVPAFLPDNETVRTDLLDYAFEIEWFDQHLVRMLDLLDQTGQLENTIVIVTADNGMPFPRAKGQAYELSNHLPLAIRWPQGIREPGRTVDEYMSFIDIAPTLVELAGLKWSETGMAPSPGRSLTDVFSKQVVPGSRDHVLIGQERHDVGRPNDEGYPIRGIVKNGTLYLHNFEPSRWPACNPETGYLNCDGSPSKTEVLTTRTQPDRRHFWELSFGKRSAEEMYHVRADPDCLFNVADSPAFATLRESLKSQLFNELRQQEDPRLLGRGEVFDKYPFANESLRNFYERYLSGESLHAGWVNPTDFERSPVE